MGPGGVKTDTDQSDTGIEQSESDTPQDIKELAEKICELQNSVYVLRTNINAVEQAILAEKTEELCEGKHSNEEKVIAIAQWICENVANRSYDYPQNIVQDDSFGWFATRNGLCNARANICVNMVEYLNLEAHVINIYDFPSAQSGHSAVEVYYDEQWHFFDPTNGGYFKGPDGEVMSLEEMHQNPKAAMAGMVVFEKTLDKRDNYQMMDYYYSVESLESMRSYAPMTRADTAVVYPTVDLEGKKEWRIGELDEDDEDVRLDGMDQNLSQYLNFGLANPFVNADVQTEWKFENCDLNTQYYIEYYFYGGTTGEFQIIGENAEIIEGDRLKIEEEVGEDGKGTWKIGFIPASEECSIRITHDFMEVGVGANIDQIYIYSIADN